MSGLDGACGARTPPGCDPGGTRLGGPIDPGGRGMESNPGGVCPIAGDTRTPHATSKAAAGRRPRDSMAAKAVMMPRFTAANLANSSRWAEFVSVPGPCYAQPGRLFRICTYRMPEALDLLKTRRSVKPIELSGPGPTATELDMLLTVASRVPDHGKLTPWRFIVFDGEARLKAGAAIETIFKTDNPAATADQIAFERNRLARAPLVVAVVSRAAPHVKIPEWEQVLSAGAAAMNLVTAAHALGFAANWITEWYAYDRRVLDALGLSPHEKIAGFVHIGRPAKPPEDRPRTPLSDIVTRF